MVEPGNNPLQARHLVISGRVQGVFYRATMTEKANALGLTGWCRNLPDGRVEAFAQGSADQLDALVEWAEAGPPQASVDHVDVSDGEPERTLSGGFEVRR